MGWMLGTIVVGANMTPLWRVALLRPYRLAAPRRSQVIGSAAAVGSAATVVGAWIAPTSVLVSAAIGSSLVSLAWLVRSRPGHGRRRGLPPGRLQFAPIGPISDVHDVERRARRYGPVFKMGSTHPRLSLRPVVCIVDNDLALDLLRHHDHDLAVSQQAFSRFVPEGVLRQMSGSTHATYARVFRSAFSAEVLERAAADTIAATTRACAAAGSDAIDPRTFVDGLLTDVMYQAMTGVGPDSPVRGQLERLERVLDSPRLSVLSSRRRVEPTLDDFVGALEDALATGHACGPSVLHGVEDHLAAERSVGTSAGDDIDSEHAPILRSTAMGNLVFMTVNGRLDMAGLATWALWYLAHEPAWWQAIAADPATGPGSPAERVVLETLRLDQSEYLFRHTTAPVEVGGYRVPAGWGVRICIREAHRDERVFAAADRFDPDRFIDRADHVVGPPRFAPFGLFRHHCVGAQLTRFVLARMLCTMAERYDLEPVGPASRIHGSQHWQPDPQFRVRLIERRPASSCPPSS